MPQRKRKDPPKAKATSPKAKGTPGGKPGEHKHPTPRCTLCLGDKAITDAQAKQLLGWEEEGTEKFGTSYLLRDQWGNKIRCMNNLTNRPLYKTVYLRLVQEVLRKRWMYNGEPIIIGKQTGALLNGQHSLIGLVLACQQWEAEQPIWLFHWPDRPTMEKAINYGVDEADGVVNTLDTCKPRTLADVVYRSKYFTDLQEKDRQRVSRMMESAVKLLWARTGAGSEVFNPSRVYRTHAESLAFIDNHPKITECIKHVYEEDGTEGRIAAYVPPGYAAGFLYMMGSCKTDPKQYRQADLPHEDHLTWGMWDKACDFFALLAGRAPEVEDIRKAKLHLLEYDRWGPRDKWALLAKAWAQYATQDKVTLGGCLPKYTKDENGIRTLAECPIVGGIDCGEILEAVDEDSITANDPTPEEIESRKPKHKTPTEQRTKANSKAKAKPKAQEKPPAATTPKAKPKPKPKKKPRSKKPLGPVVGDVVWVPGNGKDNHYQGRIVEALGKSLKLKVANGFAGAGSIRTATVATVQEKQPTAAA